MARGCDIEGCARAHKGHGLCKLHLGRKERYGDPHVLPVKAHHSIPFDQRPWGTDANGYHRKFDKGQIFYQHRVVMEGLIGRPLLPSETVHHLNGVRTDNRPENLELWVSHQPKGQRADDLLAWAREILALYGQGFSDTGTGV